MTSKNSDVMLPTLTFRSRWSDVRIDTGELLFPGIVLLFCMGYYYDTRGLPEESLLYAGPLLYATALLAVVTIFGHAVSVAPSENEQSQAEDSQSVVWGMEKIAVEREHPQKDPAEETSASGQADNGPENDGPVFFSIRSGAVIALLTTIYIFSLYVIPFVLGTALFLALAVYLFGERSILRIAIYSLGFTTILWLIFINWLLVPLP